MNKFLCETCPINCLPEEAKVVSAGLVDRAEKLDTRVGRATSEVGIMANACRVTKSYGDCESPRATEGMALYAFGGEGYETNPTDPKFGLARKIAHQAITMADIDFVRTPEVVEPSYSMFGDDRLS